MKKILSVVALSAVIFAGNAIGAADNAEAYFEDAALWRVVYDDALNYEVVTDLGNVNDLLAAGSSTVGGGGDAWTLSMFPENTAYSNLNVAYFACDDHLLGLDPVTYMPTYKDDGWASGAAGGETSGYMAWGSYAGAISGLQVNYSAPGTATVRGSIGGSNTYWANMNISGAETGSFAGFIPVPNGSEAVLGDLATAEYVEQYLYFWDDEIHDLNDPYPGQHVASIWTNADGSTTINPTSAVPIPATVLLFGSGLLGLMGIKRRSGK